MKVWQGYGSEHSSNLVMIGQFEDVDTARETKDLIESFIENVREDIDEGIISLDEPLDRYPDHWLEFLSDKNIHNIGPGELNQFAYEVDVDIDENKVVLTTEEINVFAFMKLIIKERGKVQVFSAHDHPSEYGH